MNNSPSSTIESPEGSHMQMFIMPPAPPSPALFKPAPPAPPSREAFALTPPSLAAGRSSAITADELGAIVQPLVGFLRDLDNDDCVEPDGVVIEIADPLGLQCSLPAVFIQLPQNLCDRPWLHRGLVRALLALLARSVWASSCCKAEIAEQNCRCCPLQFRLVKQTRELPGVKRYWSCMHLTVEAVSSDVAAAARQVAFLIRFLREDTEVLARDVEDFLQL